MRKKKKPSTRKSDFRSGRRRSPSHGGRVRKPEVNRYVYVTSHRNINNSRGLCMRGHVTRIRRRCARQHQTTANITVVAVSRASRGFRNKLGSSTLITFAPGARFAPVKFRIQTRLFRTMSYPPCPSPSPALTHTPHHRSTRLSTFRSHPFPHA